MVATRRGKVDQDYIRAALQDQATHYGKTIRLCRFVFREVESVLEP